jgi:hypothetical protein
MNGKARFEWSRGGASDIDWRSSTSPQRRRLWEQPSQFRWEDQFNLSLGLMCGPRPERWKMFLEKSVDNFAP